MIRYYLIALVVVIIDQLSKLLIIKKMDIGESITIINDFFFITSHRNQGAAWGILQGQMTFFYIITAIVVIGIIYFIKTQVHNNRLLGYSLGLILGGAIGNFIDRLFRKEVVDFLDVMIINYDFPIFNIADSALVIGVGLIIIHTFIEERNNKKESVK